ARVRRLGSDVAVVPLVSALFPYATLFRSRRRGGIVCGGRGWGPSPRRLARRDRGGGAGRRPRLLRLLRGGGLLGLGRLRGGRRCGLVPGRGTLGRCGLVPGRRTLG